MTDLLMAEGRRKPEALTAGPGAARPRCAKAGGEAPDPESGAPQSGHTAGQSPRPTSPLAYINCYINGCGRP
jgi:hypothetical protein